MRDFCAVVVVVIVGGAVETPLVRPIEVVDVPLHPALDHAVATRILGQADGRQIAVIRIDSLSAVQKSAIRSHSGGHPLGSGAEIVLVRSGISHR